MAKTVVERRVTRTTTSPASGKALKESIHMIATELGVVRDRAREEVAALDRIRNMLDITHLDSLLRAVEELEVRMEELENSALFSQDAVDRLKNELEAEQQRLAKLWEAFKNQEDELDRLKRDYPLMEEKLFERERTIDNLRKEIALLEPLSHYKADFDDAVAKNKALVRDLETAENELRQAADVIRNLQEENDGLSELRPYKTRVSELERQLAEERERLAKLYRVYEDMEAEKKDQDRRLDNWEAWFRKFAPLMDQASGGMGAAPAGTEARV